MKKLIIIICLMAQAATAQTVLINGQSYSANDTVKITTTYALVQAVNIPNYVTYMEQVYVGVKTTFNNPEEFMVTTKPKLLRINFYSNGTKCATFRIYLVR